MNFCTVLSCFEKVFFLVCNFTLLHMYCSEKYCSTWTFYLFYTLLGKSTFPSEFILNFYPVLQFELILHFELIIFFALFALVFIAERQKIFFHEQSTNYWIFQYTSYLNSGLFEKLYIFRVIFHKVYQSCLSYKTCNNPGFYSFTKLLI